ncbi:Peptidylprolyl isomerase [Petrocella atlantisensis]|uniref:Peptidylprolyl isomerase n=1 Tax=Petrocella atlantisensis TaxID=2173034 RepID=A0A3P7RXC5_9FIRM|nr:peptidylprolyl isomerase [Petrocella atlantisensis]MCF8019223.1 peptidylprolyl isomerase [Vallitaleaceae bacterium]PKM55929.1 MAG: peptidylprolyl isomerase [Firmicutes bacterium HGW-Firmicutes-5]VDN47386.1 Peptidylprolyl isomerase [Petrocella atlantisensis]
MEKIVLAKVGDRELTKEDMIAIMRNLPQQDAQNFSSFEGRKVLLDEMVAGELFYKRAVENGFDQEEKFIEIMAETKRAMLQRYAVQKSLDAITVEPSEVEAYYEAHKNNFSEGPKAKAKHILMTDEADILEVKNEIDTGMDFEEAARKYSTCPSKERGGDLGTFERGRMVPEFEDAAFTQEIGLVGDPVKTQFGYHLLLVEERVEASVKAFEEVENQVRQELIGRKQTEVYRSEIEALKEIYPVEINEDGLK